MTLEERARAYASAEGFYKDGTPVMRAEYEAYIEGAKAVIAEVREKLKPLVDKARTLNNEIGMQRIDKKNCFIDMCNLIVVALEVEQILKECEG